MSIGAFRRSLGQLYSALTEIAENIDYVQHQLPTLTIPDVERSGVGKVCKEFESAIVDVRKEVRNLEDKLGLHPGEEPFDPEMRNPDPRGSMGLIDRWLQTATQAMHQTVLRLEKVSKDSASVGIVSVLVAESAANILNAYTTVQNALGDIETQLQRGGAT